MDKRRTNKKEGRRSAAVGFRAHSGWAALVVVGGPPASPTVIGRQVIELADRSIWGSKQPYHAAEGLALKEAEKLIRRCTHSTRLLAGRALRAVIGEVRKKGYEVRGCGLLLASGRPVPTLAATLASHALIHTAEGELFRDALAHASEECGLPVTCVRERELLQGAAAALRTPAERLPRRLAELGRSLGPPWTQDQKQAALVALLVLAAAHGDD